MVRRRWPRTWDCTNLVYATWSQGFRRGGVNALPPTENGGYVTPPALSKLAPDTANNYEVGAKGTVDNRLRYATAIYDIEWHNIQEGVDLTPLVLPGALNIAGTPKSSVALGLESRRSSATATNPSCPNRARWDSRWPTSSSSASSARRGRLGHECRR
jgi:outer membrane receptor protein involved in Fe transport